jgi:peptidoglycan/xylan/chitin deacetylase (PgdA/CDA1 family)
MLGRELRTVLGPFAARRPASGPRVVVYHSVDASGSVLSVSRDELRRQLATLKALGWRGLTLPEYLARAAGAPGEAREVLITFDDGYENFYADAAPVLGELGLPATVFVVTDHVGGRPLWFARDRARIERLTAAVGLTGADRAALAALADAPLMSWAQARELARHGVDVASHSAAHAFLTTLSDAALAADLRRSRETLEDRLGVRGDALCYPYGDEDERVRRAAREAGFRVAFAATAAGRPGDALAIGRSAMRSRMTPGELQFALSPAAGSYAALFRSRRRADTVAH